VLVKSVSEEVLQIVKTDARVQAGDRARVKEVIDTKLAPHCDFERMTALAFPALLALLGTALLAFAVLAPDRPPRHAQGDTVSYGPPEPIAVERWTPPFADEPLLPAQPHVAKARWPEALDARAAGADAATRLQLVDALAAVRGPWALALLERAREDEPDAGVLGAIEASLSGRTGR